MLLPVKEVMKEKQNIRKRSSYLNLNRLWPSRSNSITKFSTLILLIFNAGHSFVSVNGAKFNVVGMTCQPNMPAELTGFRWDCSDESCYDGEAYLTAEMSLSYLYRGGWRGLKDSGDEDGDGDNSHDSGDNSHDSGDSHDKEEEEEEDYDPASDMTFPVLLTGTVYGKAVMNDLTDLCGLSQCQAHSRYNSSMKRYLSYEQESYGYGSGYGYSGNTSNFTDDYSYNSSNASAYYDYDDDDGYDDAYYNNCSYYCPSNGLYTISFPLNISDVTNHWYLSGLGFSTRIKMYNYYNHRLVIADCVASVQVQTYRKVLGLSIPSGYMVLVKFPFLATLSIAIVVFIVQKTIKIRNDHIHNKLYYGPNYKHRLAVKEFLPRPNNKDKQNDADAVHNNYDNFMAYKKKQKRKEEAKKKKKQQYISQVQNANASTNAAASNGYANPLIRKGSSSSTSSSSSSEKEIL